MRARAPAPVLGPLGARAAAGFAFMTAQSLLGRVASFVAQWVLAWLLVPEDFGLFAVAMGIASFATVLQQIGVREVLISRQRHFDKWANVGAWISGAAAGAAGILIAASAPLAAWFFHDPRLLGMMLVLAAAQPLYGLATVHEARLQIDMRFRALAACNLVQGLSQPVLMVVFAWAGWGAFAFVVPRLVAGVARVVVLHMLVRVPMRADPQWRLWKYVVLPGVVLLATSLVNTVAPSAPALILAKLEGKEAAGHFGFAFNVTLTGIVLLGSTLDSVMLPTLAKLAGQPERQRSAYLRVTSVLAAAIVPLCALQALTARPLFALLFGGKWDAAAPIAEVLSVGMIYLAAFIPASSMLMAQGRFAARFWIGLWAAVAFVAAALAVGQVAGSIGVAVSMALLYAITGPILAAMALRPLGGRWVETLHALGPSHVAGLCGAIASVGVLAVMPDQTRWQQGAEIGAVIVAFGAVYAVILRVVSQETWKELSSLARPAWNRVSGLASK